MDRNSVEKLLSSHRAELNARGVRTLSIFGSVARNEAGPQSDVDILVEFEGAADFDRYMDLKFYLEDLLDSRVDLVTRGALKPRMQQVVEREAVRVA